MTETVTRRIFAYKINTPIANLEEDTQDAMRHKVYYKETFEHLLSQVMHQEGNIKALKEDGKFFDINSYQISEDTDFIEGVFHTTRYGTQNDIIEIETQKVQGQVLPTQGVKYDVHFVLCRSTGLLLVESDPYRVATRNTIDHYLSKKQVLMHDYVKDFNKTKHPFFIYDTMLFTIESVLDSGFYEQLTKINKVKEVSGFMSIDEQGKNAALSHFKKSNSEEQENGSNEDDIAEISEFRVSLINRTRNTGIKHVQRFINNQLDLEKFSRFEVAGYDNQNKPRSATFNVKPVDFYVDVEQNTNGIINSTELFQEMVHIAKNENPLLEKKDADEIQNKKE